VKEDRDPAQTRPDRKSRQPLRVVNVSKKYGEVDALLPTTIEIRAGSLTALLGPSGCGKTTTLRIIAGLEYPDQGRVFIGDRDITDIVPNRRGLGMVFQNYSLFPHLTVFENVAFGLRMRKTPEDKVRRKVAEQLDLVRLPDAGGRYPRQLSGGQQQRVALARALATDPDILLLDEPLGALDKNLRENMQFELRQLQQALSITTVLVTHDQEEALTMSDEVVVMDHGRVVQAGPPHEIYERPQSHFVSEFLGAANILPIHIDDLPCAVVDLGQQRHALRIDAGGGVWNGRASLVIRPEKCWLATTPPSGANGLPGTLVGHAFRGSQHAFQVAVAGLDRALTVYAQATDIGSDSLPMAGASVFVCWKPENAVILEEADRAGR